MLRGVRGAESRMTAITDFLLEARAGHREGIDRLFGSVYEELRRIAHHTLRHEQTGHTLSTTGLVHEAYFKLVDQAGWNGAIGVTSSASRRGRCGRSWWSTPASAAR